MTIFDIFTLVGGLAMFLYGMNVMGAGLERCAGKRMKAILGNMTSNVFKGFMLGLGVTAIIQSSSATTVMVVGFVNSNLMTIRQAIGVIMGANLGTSVTSWILSLTGIEGDNIFIQLLKPSSFVPVLAMVGIVITMFAKTARKKDFGEILLGFAVLMFGMEAMSGAVEGLKEVPEFTRLLTLFSNPILGVLVGTVVTAVIQSSSASVGILQALTMTGSVTYATAVPVIMGQNIGTCVSAMISSIGASRNARRAAIIHLSFNVIATLILLPLYYVAEKLFLQELAASVATPLGIAVVHTVFKIIALAMLMPCSGMLEKLAYFVIPEAKETNKAQLLDERLLATPSVALAQCQALTNTMASVAVTSVKEACSMIGGYDDKIFHKVQEDENQVDMYEDKLGSFLVKLSSHALSDTDAGETNKLLHVIGDFERISDHAANIADSFEEIRDKELEFSERAKKELGTIMAAIDEILDLSVDAFTNGNLESAAKVEPLEQVVDYLKESLKKRHIARLQKQECTIELGFVLSDLLTNLERISDHCSNIAGCVLEIENNEMDIHQYLRDVKDGSLPEFRESYEVFKSKYQLADS